MLRGLSELVSRLEILCRLRTEKPKRGNPLGR